MNDTHEENIDGGIFQHAQEIFGVRDYETKYAPKDGVKHLLSGMTFITSGAKTVYVIYSRYKNHKMCTRHSIPEKELEASVTENLKKIAAYASDYEKLLATAQKNATHTKEDDPIRLEMASMDARVCEIKKTLKTYRGARKSS